MAKRQARRFVRQELARCAVTRLVSVTAELPPLEEPPTPQYDTVQYEVFGKVGGSWIVPKTYEDREAAFRLADRHDLMVTEKASRVVRQWGAVDG